MINETIVEINDTDWKRKVLRHIMDGSLRPEMREEAGKRLRELEEENE